MDFTTYIGKNHSSDSEKDKKTELYYYNFLTIYKPQCNIIGSRHSKFYINPYTVNPITTR